MEGIKVREGLGVGKRGIEAVAPGRGSRCGGFAGGKSLGLRGGQLVGLKVKWTKKGDVRIGR